MDTDRTEGQIGKESAYAQMKNAWQRDALNCITLVYGPEGHAMRSAVMRDVEAGDRLAMLNLFILATNLAPAMGINDEVRAAWTKHQDDIRGDLAHALVHSLLEPIRPEDINAFARRISGHPAVVHRMIEELRQLPRALFYARKGHEGEDRYAREYARVVEALDRFNQCYAAYPARPHQATMTASPSGGLFHPVFRSLTHEQIAWIFTPEPGL